MGVPLWHPVTGAVYDAPGDDAVAHYRASGWLRLDEREEFLARATERAELEAAEASKAKGKGKTATEEK